MSEKFGMYIRSNVDRTAGGTGRQIAESLLRYLELSRVSGILFGNIPESLQQSLLVLQLQDYLGKKPTLNSPSILSSILLRET